MATKFKEKLDYIKKAVAEGKYRYTIHGARQRIARGFRRKEVEESIESSEVIEDYPDHHYGSACLLLGKTKKGKNLHILCSLWEIVDIITVYEPDFIEWEKDLKTRRRK